jgi:glycerophosphoryl diester phosphodiesterase
VDALTLEQLRAFDAGNGERIPTLEDVLKIAAGRTGLMVELKVTGLAHLIVEAVQKARSGNPIIYASFLHQALDEIRSITPKSALMPLFDKLPKARLSYAKADRPGYVGIRHDRAQRALVEALHQENVLVWVYTANSPDDISRAISAGVDGIISDFPDRIPTQ